MMTLDEAIREAAGVLKQGEEANWRLAQLTYEHTLHRGEYQNPGEKVPLAIWCGRVRETAREKFSDRTGRYYRAAWAYRISAGSTDMPSFNEVLRRIAPEYYDTDVVQARVWATGVEKHLTGGTPEAKRQTFLRLANDPEVASPQTVDAAMTLLAQRAREVRGMPPVPPPLHPEAQEAAEARADGLGLGEAINPLRLMDRVLTARIAAEEYAEALRAMGPLDAEGRAIEAAHIGTVLSDWAALREIVLGGSVAGAVETFLTAVRAGED